MSHGTVHNILCLTGTNLDAPARQILDLIAARVLMWTSIAVPKNGSSACDSSIRSRKHAVVMRPMPRDIRRNGPRAERSYPKRRAVQEIPRPAVLGAHGLRIRHPPTGIPLPGGARRARPVTGAPVRSGERIHEEMAQSVQLPAQVCARDPGQMSRRCRAREIHASSWATPTKICSGSCWIRGFRQPSAARGLREIWCTGRYADPSGGHDAGSNLFSCVRHGKRGIDHLAEIANTSGRRHLWLALCHQRNSFSSSSCLASTCPIAPF